MKRTRVSAIALVAGLIALATVEPGSARADGFVPEPGYGPILPGPRHRRHARILPPEVRYRDPRAARIAPPRGPDFAIHAYLPRYTDVPMYNEPPARFPQR